MLQVSILTATTRGIESQFCSPCAAEPGRDRTKQEGWECDDSPGSNDFGCSLGRVDGFLLRRFYRLRVLHLILRHLRLGLIQRNVLDTCKRVGSPIARVVRVGLIPGDGGLHSRDGRVAQSLRITAVRHRSDLLLDG